MDKKTKIDTPVTASEDLQGRSVFSIETIAQGVRVQTSFLTQDGKILPLPAVFPDQVYALAQLDELRAAVIKHFAEAAQVGAKVIAQSAGAGPSSKDTIQ